MIRLIFLSLVLSVSTAAPLSALVDPILGGTTGFDGYPYRLYTPETASPENPLPLILFLHGSFERGTDNEKHVQSHIQPLIDSCMGTEFPAFLVAPQSAIYWDPMILRQLTESLIQTLPVDPRRVYITGISVGGRATWDTASKGLDLFAAGIPLSPREQLDATQRLGSSGIPLWAFHGDSDPIVPLQETTDMISGIQSAGGNPRFTLLAGFAHNDWTPIYADQAGFTDHWTGGPEADVTNSLYPWIFAKQLPGTPYAYPLLMDGETVLLDFGEVHTQPGSSTWNNIGVDPATPRTLITALLTSTGEPRKMGLRISDGFEGTLGTGMNQSSLYPGDVTRDAWWTGSSDGHEMALTKPASIVITGLPIDQSFRLRFYAARQGSGDSPSYKTRFTVNGQSADVEASNNASQRATLYRTVADNEGNLEITVSPSPDGTGQFAYLNALELLVEPWPLTFAYWSEMRGIDPELPGQDQNRNTIPELLDFLFGNETGGLTRNASIEIVDGQLSVMFPIRTEPTSTGLLVFEQSSDLHDPWEALGYYDFSNDEATNLERLTDESGVWLRADFPTEVGKFYRLRGEIP